MGIGPGSQADRTLRAIDAIERADIVAGYHKYMELIEDLTQGKTCISTGMMREEERVAQALEKAQEGHTVALVSSGDAGVYGMAGLALEMAQAKNQEIAVEIIPGVTAANTAAARLGAPLMLDYCCVSLSDLMIPWEQIEKRLQAAALGDFVVALYNPRSVKRRRQLEEAVRIFLEHRPGTTPVGIVDRIGLEGECVVHTDLSHLLECEVGMRSTVLIGNSTTYWHAGRMITPRGYMEA